VCVCVCVCVCVAVLPLFRQNSVSVYVLQKLDV